LEAMACATPVITTPRAVSALQAVPGEDVLVADNAADFASAILDVLGNPAKQEMLGSNGRRYVETTHQWAAIANQLETIYQETINTHSQQVAWVRE
ncbi:MAG TPA: glycosyltransferase, partial [Anaerolineae bacterium]|nr:glycosyltransferase [Anaerolineae bacterium]